MTSVEFRTTGIGSLPHHNFDSALHFAFQADIPFLPQIPIRNPWEFMLAQALERLPGLSAESDGTVSLNLDIWETLRAQFDEELATAFQRSATDHGAFHGFEPSAAISSCWQPFVWELTERETPVAKVQIAGPLTSQWSLKLLRHQQNISGVRRPEVNPEVSTQVSMQIYRLVLARALAMTRKLQSHSIKPILYLDEPGLYGLTRSNPKHLMGLQELKLMIQTLRKDGVQVGLHCCSNTDWSLILGLGLDIISIDVALSLSSLLSSQNSKLVEDYVKTGGRFSFGVIPTARSAVLQSIEPAPLFSELLGAFENWNHQPDFVRKVLAEALYTPACGLALHSVNDADLIMELLLEFKTYIYKNLN